MPRPAFHHSLLLGILLLLTATLPASAEDSILPMGPDTAPIAADHFPTPAHAVIWRNWFLVSPATLARPLQTTESAVSDTAQSMGLPRSPTISPAWQKQGYITIVRRNWHLLPYEQILPLIGMSGEELAFALREDDFLFIKLGSRKPRCAPVRLTERTEAIRQQESRIFSLVINAAGDKWTTHVEAPFTFLDQLSASSGQPPRPLPADWRSAPPRFIYSYFGSFGDPLSGEAADPYPDGLLEKLAASGANGVWLHVVLRQLTPPTADFPEFGEGHEKRLETLRSMVQRAARHGMQVYLYLNEPRAMPEAFFKDRPDLAGVSENGYRALCTSDPKVRKWLTDATAHVFKEVPGLGGILTISASENLTHCASHFRESGCPRCSQRDSDEVIAEANTALEEGVHRSAPDARVFLWDWGWHKHGLSPGIISRLPKNSWLLSVSEWDAPFERGGVPGKVGEYSMSVPGPGPRARAQWKSAREAGLKTAAKVQFNNTWELASVPWLPVGDLIARHCEALAQEQVGGLMLSWSLGGHPSPNLEIAKRYFDSTGAAPPDREKVLNEIATHAYGASAAPHVRKAWQHFSTAFLEYPYSGRTVYQGPQHMGPANLPYSAPTGLPATMVGLPYDDLKSWRGPYPEEAFAEQFAKISAGWKEGIAEMEEALYDDEYGTAEQEHRLLVDAGLAQAAGIHFASSATQVRHVMSRDVFLAAKPGSPERAAAKRELQKNLQELASLAAQLCLLASADSRIGFEASNHYFYRPHDLLETMIAVDWQRTRLDQE